MNGLKGQNKIEKNLEKKKPDALFLDQRRKTELRIRIDWGGKKNRFQEIVDKIFSQVRYLASCVVDLAYHRPDVLEKWRQL